jgi:predicted phage-related endonuclease
LLTSQQTDAFVDELEDSLFDYMRDISSAYFAPALDTGELPEPLLKEALVVLTPVKRRRLLHTKSKAPITPIKKTKHLSKTRRKAVTEQPKLETPVEQ